MPPDPGNDIDSCGDSDDENSPSMDFSKLSKGLLATSGEVLVRDGADSQDELEEDLGLLPPCSPQPSLPDLSACHILSPSSSNNNNNSEIPPAVRKSKKVVVKHKRPELKKNMKKVAAIGSKRKRKEAMDDTDSGSDMENDENNPATVKRFPKAKVVKPKRSELKKNMKKVPATGSKSKGKEAMDDTDSGSDMESDENNQATVKRVPKGRNPEYERIWNDDSSNVGSKVKNFEPNANQFDSEEVKSCKSPYQYWRLFTSDNFMQEIVSQSKTYAHQKGKARSASEVNVDSLLCLEAVMLLSGYCKVPNRRMYWQDRPDTHNKLVANSIRRDQVDF